MNSAGEIFRTTRQSRNLSIEDVSRITKIRPRVIEAIEQGEFSALPSAYMRSFIKTYSHFLQIPEPDVPLNDAAVEARFQPAKTAVLEDTSKVAAYQPGYVPEYLRTSSRAGALKFIYAGVALLLGAVGYLVFFGSPFDKITRSKEPANTRPLQINSDGTDGQTAFTVKRDSTGKSEQQEPDSLILEARANESAWLNIVMDKKRTDQLTLEPGKSYRWSAEKIFNLSLGNAGGVYFSLNGRPIEPFGKKGTVVRDIRITREMIASSSTPALAKALGGTNASSSEPPASTQSAPQNVQPQVSPTLSASKAGMTQTPPSAQQSQPTSPQTQSLQSQQSARPLVAARTDTSSAPRKIYRKKPVAPPPIIPIGPPQIAPPQPQITPPTNKIKQ